MAAPKAFVSHSHADKAVAEKVSAAFRRQGVDAWFDKWEIQPGDSLIERIFEVGLKDCAAFVVLLSPDSVASPWVRHELDVAMVRRIEGTVRVIPIVVQPCEIPLALRPLLRVDLTKDFEAGVRRVVDAILGQSEKPPVRMPPPVVQVPGLTTHAARLAVQISGSMDTSSGRPPTIGGAELAKSLEFAPEQLNDAAEELEAIGLVKLHHFLGTAPYSFGLLEATYALALQLKGTNALDYDPEEDILIVAVAIAESDVVTGPQLEEATKLPPSRINNAVQYLDDYGIVRTLATLGTMPFTFAQVTATAATRRFVAERGRISVT